jgi:D-glycero-alpha-D-manno-heptose-7-phosphate kinase
MVREAKSMLTEQRGALQRGEIYPLGEILHSGWSLKRELAEGISNSVIDGHYEKGCSAGASGRQAARRGRRDSCCCTGRPSWQAAVRNALPLREVAFSFDMQGSRIAHVDEQ